MTQNRTRALVVDDNPVVRAGLLALLEASGTIEVIGEAGDGREAIDQAQRIQPDIALLDVRMPVVDGMTAVEHLVPIAPVMMLTHTEDPETIQTTLRRGASGYLVHGAFTAEELDTAVHNVIAGDRNPLSPSAVGALVNAVREPSSAPAPAEHPPGYLGLSEREVEIMKLISKGLSNPQIGGQLFLAEKTVKNHVNRIFSKLDVSSRAAAIARWNGTHD
ncbi:LuxR family two component transcriptional regulator [Haloactinospora alba]|uniref:LuxR family two component transcriptional regulator n=1 Tax=Haloactinospora alba TaxID=405555 RepID=A0A543NGE9_9ACTN|nr:response regulator transcription factor [Haloactinospora alba]TQN30928.1 LuxR family two component transcriptional regulator [Haloactinospora alba]